MESAIDSGFNGFWFDHCLHGETNVYSVTSPKRYQRAHANLSGPGSRAAANCYGYAFANKQAKKIFSDHALTDKNPGANSRTTDRLT